MNGCANISKQLLNCLTCNLSATLFENINSVHNAEAFKKRSEEEIIDIRSYWRDLVHNRAYKHFKDDLSAIDNYFTVILEQTPSMTDPVSPINDNDCVIWNGDVSPSGHAALSIIGDNSKRSCLVIRLLCFFFADDQSYKAVAKEYPKGPIDMVCNNKLCVSIHHIDFKITELEKAPTFAIDT